MVLAMEVAGNCESLYDDDDTNSIIDSWIAEYARDRIWRHFKHFGCSQMEFIDPYVRGMYFLSP
jgi:hypothetical protein